MGIAFSGWNDPSKAKGESDPVYDKLAGDKWIDAGGGDASGRWNADFLSKWEAEITSGHLSKWKGIVFDIEECYSSGLASSFASAFRAAKSHGLQVLVTISHSAPYGCKDAATLMESFFSNGDIDYLSPQLYSSGDETAPEFDADTVPWSQYSGMKARFVPSLGCKAVNNGGFQQCKDYFNKFGVATVGYIVWPSSGCKVSGNETELLV